MAVAIPIQEIPSFGEAFDGVTNNELVLTVSDVAGMTLVNDNAGLGTYVYAENLSAGVLTFDIEGRPGPDSNRDIIKSVSLAAGQRTVVGPFRPELYNNNDGEIEITVPAADAAFKFAAVHLSAG